MRVSPNWSTALGRVVDEGDWSDLERDHQTGHLDRNGFLAAMARRLHASAEEAAAAHDGWIEGEMEGGIALGGSESRRPHHRMFVQHLCLPLGRNAAVADLPPY